jgi:hypothetical protein
MLGTRGTRVPIRKVVVAAIVASCLVVSALSCTSSDSSADDCADAVAVAEDRLRTLEEAVRSANSPGGGDVTVGEQDRLQQAQDAVEEARGCNQ